MTNRNWILGIFKIYLLGILSHYQSLAKSVFLNHTVTLSSGISIAEGFSFSFRACSLGVLLRQSTDDLMLSLVSGDTNTSHAKLVLSWKYENKTMNKSMELAPLFSMDNNVEVIVQVRSNNTGSMFEVKSSVSKLDSRNLFIQDIYLQNLPAKSQLIIGSSEFTGCISGLNVDISSCPLDNLTPCIGHKCPAGYVGRYCEVDIDECVASTEQCHHFSTCVDKVNGFECICGANWKGRLCDQKIGDPCENVTCLNGGICKVTDDHNNFTCSCPDTFVGRFCEISFFPCITQPCKNGGTCTNETVTDYSCKCITGFVGKNCDRNIDDCALKPCNQGQCIDGVNNYTCNCTGSGFAGEFCQRDINECIISSPCQNRATCQNLFGTYKCFCQSGFSGRNCEVNIDDCERQPCENGGTCSDQVDDYNCSCQAGFKGKNCSINIDECESQPCVNAILCEDRINDYQCNCKPGYTGKNCNSNIDECVSQPCQNNGTCEDGIGNYSCHCMVGFNGLNCEHNINDCTEDSCQNGGTCYDKVNNYTCSCAVGFNGTNCENNIDDCALNPCLNHGTCIDQINGYNCSCIPSYTGRNCETYQDPCTPNPCKNGASCLNDTKLGYKCNCTQEFGGKNCENKFGICFPTNPCEHGKCNETAGSYTCTCDKGYTGKNCSTNINECENITCSNKGICVDTPGSFFCNCSGTGYDGEFCQKDINECETGVHKCINGSCIDVLGDYHCSCNVGWEGDFCNEPDFPCSDFNAKYGEDYCKNKGGCKRVFGDKRYPKKKMCICVPGYTGTRCETNINECDLGYCENNSTCVDLINDYNCTCQLGFTGRNCSTDIDECLPNPCQNNASCEDMINMFKCNCPPGYNGTFCENDIEWCLSSPCQNGATCNEEVEKYTCSCLPGFIGVNCEEDIQDCEPNPCVYHGLNNSKIESTCIEKSNITAMKAYNYPVNETHYHRRDGYICKCLLGLEGKNCSTDIKDCNDTLCMNEAQCVELVNDFQCICHAGFTGKTCQTNIDDCSPSPCLNNGTCIDHVNGYKCNCTSKYKGDNCSEPLNFCTLCENDAKCDKTGDKLKCVCTDGFTGETCSISTTFNLKGDGYWEIDAMNNTNEKNNLSASFRTTLPNGLILQTIFPTETLSVYLKNNTLLLTNGTTSITIGQNLNDNIWHTLKMAMDGSVINIFVDQVKTGTVALNGRTKVITNIYLGGSGSHSGSNFTGCIQDFMVNTNKFPPRNGIRVHTIIGACNKTTVCHDRSCNQHGRCIDQWNTRRCECFRQYFGDSCESEISAFNFQQTTSTNTTRKRRSTTSKHAVSAVDFNISSSFSFLIRTRQSDGFLALLLSTQDTSSDYTYLLYYIKDGALGMIKGSKNAEATRNFRGNITLNDGQWHTITQDNTKLNSVLFDIGDVSVKQVYLAGIPDYSMYSDILPTNISFDGCLQAIKVGESFLTNQNIPSTPTNGITLTGAGLGCQGADVCSSSPCLYKGNCTDLWNDFNCSCRVGFAGERCTVYGCRVQVDACPSSSDCIDVPNRPGVIKCSSPLTYNGFNSSSTVRVRNATSDRLSFAIRTVQVEGLILATRRSATEYVAVGIKDGNLVLRGKVANVSHVITGRKLNNGEWQNITITTDSFATTALNSTDRPRVGQLLSLLAQSSLQVGIHTEIDGFTNPFFGCLKNLVIGTHVYDIDVQNSSNVQANCISTKPCSTSTPCERGTCKNLFNDFECECPAFYTTKTCNTTIDVSCAFPKPLCHNGTCVNLTEGVARKYSDAGKDYFKCDCHDGFTGDVCRNVTNECTTNLCKNGGNCTDLHLDYKCTCAPGWSGKNCSDDFNECISTPCKNNGVCKDRFNNYTCDCANTGYSGRNCEQDINECDDVNFCKHNATCKNTAGSFHCDCIVGYFGDRCEYNNTLLCEKKKPCQNDGVCLSDITGYNCTCRADYTGTNCTEKLTSKVDDDDDDKLPIIIAVSVVVVLIVLAILAIVFFKFCRDKSGMEGTYSPNKEEQISGNVEMNTIKKPNTERLI